MLVLFMYDVLLIYVHIYIHTPISHIMVSQIFKTKPPLELLHNFLFSNAEYRKNKFIVSKNTFKKANLKEEAQPFIDALKKYYYNSKKYYTERKNTYKNLITIIRQVCKYYHIPFSSVMSYDKSKYLLSYHIIIPEKLKDI